MNFHFLKLKLNTNLQMIKSIICFPFYGIKFFYTFLKKKKNIISLMILDYYQTDKNKTDKEDYVFQSK